MQFNNLNSNPYLNKFNMEQAQLQTTHVGEATVSQVASTSDNKEIEAIIQRLRSGDLSALTELTALGIKYEIVTETINGVVKNTIKFSYGGNDYEVNLSLNKDNSDTDKKPNFGNINSNLSDMVKVTGAEQFGKNTNISDVKERIVYSQAKVGSTQTSEQAEQERLQKIYDAMEKELKADLEKEIQYRLDNYSNYGFTTKPSAEQIEQIKNEVWQSIQTQINTFREFLKTNCASVEEYINSEKDEDGAITNAYQTVFDAMVDSMSASLKKYGAEAKEKAEADKAAAEAEAAEKAKANTDVYAFIERKVGNVATRLPDSVRDTKSFDPRISAYYGNNNVNSGNSTGNEIFNDLLNQIKDEILDAKGDNYIKDSIGEENLVALFKAAWVSVAESMNSTSVDGREFAKKVLAKLQEMLKNLQEHPENLALLTDTKVNTDGLANYSSATLNCDGYKQYDTKEYHLNDDNSDKAFQKTMQDLLARIYDKYPNIDKDVLKDLFYQAQGQALSAIKDGNGTLPVTNKTLPTKKSIRGTTIDLSQIPMESLVDIITYKFHNLLSEKVLNDGTLKVRTTENDAKPTADSSLTEEQKTKYKDGASGVKSAIDNSSAKNGVLSACKVANGNKDNIHTEFGIDSSGNIVFEQKNTTAVYKKLVETLKNFAKNYASEAFNKLGESNFNKLVQAAWIMTYNDFPSSQSNNLDKFINKVMDNFSKMLNKIIAKPELMEVFTKHTSYADTTLTSGLKHYNTKTTYGGDETINYRGAVTKYDDGSVHISNTDDDNDYQTTMNALLQKVISKYPSIDANVITSVFREAQYAALNAMQNNNNDCPYGTGNNGSRVEDSDYKRDWGGNNNRSGDKSNIHMDQVVQLTLYYFDKLILNELTK